MTSDRVSLSGAGPFVYLKEIKMEHALVTHIFGVPVNDVDGEYGEVVDLYLHGQPGAAWLKHREIQDARHKPSFPSIHQSSYNGTIPIAAGDRLAQRLERANNERIEMAKQAEIRKQAKRVLTNKEAFAFFNGLGAAVDETIEVPVHAMGMDGFELNDTAGTDILSTGMAVSRKFHRFMNEMTITQVGTFTRAGVKRAVVMDRKGQVAVVPESWLQKLKAIPLEPGNRETRALVDGRMSQRRDELVLDGNSTSHWFVAGSANGLTWEQMYPRLVGYADLG